MPPYVFVRRHVLSLPRFARPSTENSPMQDPKLDAVFAAYETLAAQADTLFERVRDQFPAEVSCKAGCSDCCHAMFDLSLVEAMYINRKFGERFTFGAERSAILEAAGEADRKATRLKRHYYQRAKQGASDEEIMREAGQDRIRCPLLGPDDTCLMYEFRPITCRLYGVPAAIQGRGHVCGKCGFTPGSPYPTVQLDRIQDRLADMSRDIAAAVGSRFRELHTVYVPLSMALLTRYDDAYLGVGEAPKER